MIFFTSDSDGLKIKAHSESADCSIVASLTGPPIESLHNYQHQLSVQKSKPGFRNMEKYREAPLQSVVAGR
jgi:hypothetical protein